MALQDWVIDGRQVPAYGPQPLPVRSAEIIPLPALVEKNPAVEQAPVSGRGWRSRKRESVLSWPEKIMAVQIGFALESLIAALEKLVG